MTLADRLGRRILLLRHELGLSQAELARRAGMKATEISRYETGATLPTLPTVARLADALQVELAELVVFNQRTPLTMRMRALLDRLRDEPVELQIAVIEELNAILDRPG
ncbi:MAG: helix-turn-helix transcriptional regulator [Alphaproteobacteria bacterium]|nr:helix-turn-helix transcriptional regulator [Alphaproteobacteria bacterium]